MPAIKKGVPSPAGQNALSTRNSICSKKLFAADKELVIMHQECCYYLRITKNQKLILTK